MKTGRLIGALVGILAAGALAVTAFAADNTVWLCAGAEVTGTGNNRCLVEGENLETLLLWDLTADSEIECAVGSIQGEGWVGPGSEGEITSMTFLSVTTNCKPTAKALSLSEAEVTNVCESVVTPGVALLHLPWMGLIVLRAGVAYDEVRGKSGGEPGIEITCKTALGDVTDKCERPVSTGDLLPDDNLVGSSSEKPLVDVLLPFKPVRSDEEREKCSVGGAESGALEGEVLLEALSATGVSLSLEVSEL